MMHKLRIILVLLFFATSCSLSGPEAQMKKLAEQYDQKSINNLQMLLAMGKVYQSHPDNSFVKKDYFNRMIISGYTSWALHYYLAQPERIKSAEDAHIILFAITEGNHYNLAKEFVNWVDDNSRSKLIEMAELGDSLQNLNQNIKGNPDAQTYATRSKFFSSLGEPEMANLDLNKSMRFDPCNNEALFQRALVLFDRENTAEIVQMLDRCKGKVNEDILEWKPVFYKLAKDIEEVTRLAATENDKLFQITNLYVNNGFAELGLRKSQKLIETNPANADYIALHAFVYYRLGNKAMALRYITEAEDLTQRKSRLREMIEKME